MLFDVCANRPIKWWPWKFTIDSNIHLYYANILLHLEKLAHYNFFFDGFLMLDGSNILVVLVVGTGG